MDVTCTGGMIYGRDQGLGNEIEADMAAVVTVSADKI